MKLWILLALCAVAAAAPNFDKVRVVEEPFYGLQESPESRNILINALIRQLIAYVRRIINNGSSLFGIPPLDPLELEEVHLVVPAGLVNLDLHLKNVLVTGVGGFVVHRSNLRLSDLTFDIDISVPRIYIKAEQYDLDGDLFTAIPLYGLGGAEFEVESFRFRAMLHLKQSDDGQSVLLDRVEDAAFELPVVTSNLSGVIGGGDIDGIVNAMIQEVLVDYVNRFQGAISLVAGRAVVDVANPVLGQLDTWKYIAPFV